MTGIVVGCDLTVLEPGGSGLGREEDFHAVVEIIVEALFHYFQCGKPLGAGLFGNELLGAHFFFECFFHLDHGAEEFAGGAGVFDAIGEGQLEPLVAGGGDVVSPGKLGHVAALVGAVGLVFGVVANLVAVEEGVVGAGLGEEFYDERDGIDQHEEGRKDEVGGEGEASSFVA